MFVPDVRRLFLPACLALLAACPQAAQGADPALERSLESAMRSAGPASGAWVRNVTDDEHVLSWRARKRRTLASNVKIFTTSAALDRFGEDSVFETTVLAEVPPDVNGIVQGDLYLVGGGDPTFGSRTFVRRSYGRGATVESLARRVAAAGVTAVTGSVIGDETRFDSLRGGPDSGYRTSIWVGPLSALAYNRGLASESGRSFQVNPPAFAAGRLDAALARRDISVAGVPRSGPASPGAVELASIESPTMARLVQITNTRSDNFFAEVLAKQLGREVTGAGSTSAGTRAIESFARRVGVRPRLGDGSGLYRRNTASPRQVGKLLTRMMSRDEFGAFYDSLPVAGRTGTLVDRMRRGPARDRCHAKTGTISGVSALSGYCRSRGGDDYVFSFLMNGVNVYTARALQDRMANAMARAR